MKKVLYGVQGTGHGHINRAKAIIPILKNHVDLDILLSGYNYNLNFETEIKFKKRGISLKYDSYGAVDILSTASSFNIPKIIRDIRSIDVEQYDLVISDFEPISAWAAKLYGVKSISISHQASFLSEKTPRHFERSMFAENVIRYFAPTDSNIGTHFKSYDDFIEPPILRDEIIELEPTVENHYTIYLPAYSHDVIIQHLPKDLGIDYHIFSPGCDKTFTTGTITVNPIGKEDFIKSLSSCIGVITSAGFEGPSEAMYLNKKLMVIPIKNQYEQLCNAAAVQEMGGHVLYDIDQNFSSEVEKFVKEGRPLVLDEYCNIQDLVRKLKSYL